VPLSKREKMRAQRGTVRSAKECGESDGDGTDSASRDRDADGEDDGDSCDED